jgi:hypothetical protein
MIPETIKTKKISFKHDCGHTSILCVPDCFNINVAVYANCDDCNTATPKLKEDLRIYAVGDLQDLH